ncbi:hypothetical protein GOC14_28315 [Sinorhizobium meliloti]|nr:hypothetical protein [Sinorhizobium meliloti]
MSKHPQVPGVDLRTIRELFAKHEKAKNRYLLATALEVLPRPPEEADALLRQLAGAGYIKWEGTSSKDWDLTAYGLRLVADDLAPRLTRQAVDEVVGTVLDRARSINRDERRIVRITEMRLFGSALDNARNDYGDVDLEVHISVRKLPEAEVARAHAHIAAKVPQSWRDSFFRNLNAEEDYDRRDVTKELARGIKGLSLSSRATESLGCEYLCIYKFDLDTSAELAPAAEIVARRTPALKPAEEILPVPLPAHTIIEPIGLAKPDETLPSRGLSIRMEDLAFDEAVASLGQSGTDGSHIAIDTTSNVARRFAGARFLFDEWRDPGLSGLELFQRTLDWASLYDLPISKVDRVFTLRTFRKTRIANFHAFMVERVADRIDADLVLRQLDHDPSRRQRPGTSFHISPRMVAAHHSLAVALARMLDETRITGQVDFRAEFDLTGQRQNSYAALPDLSDISRLLRRMLPRVIFPDDVLSEARKRKEEYQTSLPINREFAIRAYRCDGTQQPTAFAAASLGAEWWEEPVEIDDAGNEVLGFLKGEEELWSACEPFEERLRDALAELPGCNFLSISHEAPIPAK